MQNPIATTSPTIPSNAGGDNGDEATFSSSSTSCLAFNFVESYFHHPSQQSDPFVTTITMERFHRWSPRFGHSTDITLLIEGTNDQQADYLKGLLASSMAVFCLVLLWTLWLLIVTKCRKGSCCFCCRLQDSLWTVQRHALQKPKKPTIEKPKRKLPFQHNGVAAGYNDNNNSHDKKPASSSGSAGGSGILKNPIQMAREKKRRLEAQQQKRSNKYFSKMKSTGDVLDDIDEEYNFEEDGSYSNDKQQASSSSPTALESALGRSPASQSKQSTLPTVTTSTNHEEDTTSHATGTIASSSIAAEIQLEKEKRKAWDDYYTAYNQYQEMADTQALRIYRIRIVLLFCCIGIIIAATLFVVMGIWGINEESDKSGGLFDSVTAVKDGLQQLSSICQEAIDVIDSYQERQLQARNSTLKFVLEVNDICPGFLLPPCTNVTSDEYRQCDFTLLPIGNALDILFALLRPSTTNVIFATLNDVKKDLQQVIIMLDQAQTYYPKHFGWSYWVAAGASMGLILVAIYLAMILIRLIWYTEMEMTIKPSNSHYNQHHSHHHHDDDSSSDSDNDDNDRLQRILPLSVRGIRSWLIIPLLIVLAILAWLFSMIFIIGTIGTSDFCINSPDGPMLSILNNIQDSLDSSLVPLFLSYYIRGCPSPYAATAAATAATTNTTTTFTTSSPIATMSPTVLSTVANTTNGNILALDEQITLLTETFIPAIDQLAMNVSDPIMAWQMEAVCGAVPNYLAPFLAITKALQNQFCVLAQTLDDIRELFSCDTWYPVYDETVHTAICYHANTGLGWASSTQFVIVVLVLIILTLRVGYFEFEELAYPPTSSRSATSAGSTNFSSSCCCCCFGTANRGNKIMDDDEKSTSDGEQNDA